LLRGELKLGIGKFALGALPASTTSKCLFVHEPSSCSTQHHAEAFLKVGANIGVFEVEVGLLKTISFNLVNLTRDVSTKDASFNLNVPLEYSLCVFVGCYSASPPTVSSTPSPTMPSDDPSYSNSVLDQAIFSTYQQAYTPDQPYVPNFIPTDPVPCVPGSTCPPIKEDCSYGYQFNGFPCSSGCAQTNFNPATCVQRSCCKAVVNPPSNAVHKIAGSESSFVSQGLQLTGGNFIQIQCNTGYILSGRNLGIQQLGTLAVGATFSILNCFYRWGACGGSPKDSDYTPCIAGRLSSGPLPTSNTPGVIADNRCEFVQLVPGDGGWQLDGQRMCTLANCGKYIQPANGIVTPTTERKYGESVTITCNAGYELSGDQYTSTPICQANGNFTSGKFCAPRTCAALSAPQHGLIFPPSGIASQQSVFLQCERGYETTTTANLICVNGQYIGELSTCSRVSCGSLIVPNGIVSRTGPVSFNSSISVACNTGYFLQDGIRSAVCTADRLFERDLICNKCSNCSQGTAVYRDCTADADTICSPIVCTANPPINGTVSSLFAIAGENITISCNAGFQLSRPESMYALCNNDGMFESGQVCIKGCDPGQYYGAVSGEPFCLRKRVCAWRATQAISSMVSKTFSRLRINCINFYKM
jgi:hypothetical protein